MRLCHCGAITKKGLCDRCKPPAPKQKLTTKERGYGNDWRRLSEWMRETNPLCRVCDARDKYTPATELHHIEKIRSAPHRRLDATNTIPVCKACHVEVEDMTPEALGEYLKKLEAER